MFLIMVRFTVATVARGFEGSGARETGARGPVTGARLPVTGARFAVSGTP